MAQEVRTVDQRTPQTTESGQRTPPRPVFLPPADIYETATASSCSPKCPVLLPMGSTSPSSGGC